MPSFQVTTWQHYLICDLKEDNLLRGHWCSCPWASSEKAMIEIRNITYEISHHCCLGGRFGSRKARKLYSISTRFSGTIFPLMSTMRSSSTKRMLQYTVSLFLSCGVGVVLCMYWPRGHGAGRLKIASIERPKFSLSVQVGSSVIEISSFSCFALSNERRQWSQSTVIKGHD